MNSPASSLPLKTLLNPRSVAVIGASEDQTKFGGRLYKTLLQHQYAGAVYPINPGRDTLFGLKTYPSIAATPLAKLKPCLPFSITANAFCNAVRVGLLLRA